MSMIEKKKERELEWVSYIYYFMTFIDWIETLHNSKIKVNAMSQACYFSIRSQKWKINIGAQNIYDTTLKTYKIVIYIFVPSNKDDNREIF